MYLLEIEYSLLLMQRSDIDIELRDNEGLTAFDLYNSTVAGTELSGYPHTLNALMDKDGADLYTWGGNRWVMHPTHDGGNGSTLLAVMQLWGMATVTTERTLTKS